MRTVLRATAVAVALSLAGGCAWIVRASNQPGGPTGLEAIMPALDGEGRHVAFLAQAPGGFREVHVRDLVGGTSEVVSVGADGSAADHTSMVPSVSRDGRYVVFGSRAGNLVPDDGNGDWDVFLHDRSLGTTTRVSVAADGGDASEPSGDDPLWLPYVSDDGRFVVFTSYADLAPGGSVEGESVYVRDMAEATTVAIPGAHGSRGISGDGRYVVVDTAIGGVRFDLHTGTALPFTLDALGDPMWGAVDAVMTPDGRFIAYGYTAFRSQPPERRRPSGIYVFDAELGTTEAVSLTADGSIRAGGFPAISDDGQRILFLSEADDLVADDGNGLVDYFVRDRASSTTVLASAGVLGRPATSPPVLFASLSGDGRTVAFSTVERLDPEDSGEEADVYVRAVSTPLPSAVVPAAIGPGATVDLVVTGAFLDPELHAWTSMADDIQPPGGDGVTVVSATSVSSTELHVRVVVAPDAPPGPRDLVVASRRPVEGIAGSASFGRCEGCLTVAG